MRLGEDARQLDVQLMTRACSTRRACLLKQGRWGPKDQKARYDCESPGADNSRCRVNTEAARAGAPPVATI